MALTTVAADVYRDYDLDGVPASGPHKPKKPDIRRLIGGIEQVVNAFTSAGGLIYDTRALLYADLAKSANSLAWVISDSAVDYNGVYKKVGASGAGPWERVADLPYSFIVASNQGDGTANAIEATTNIPVSSSALVLLNIFETNGDGPITVRFNGSGPVYTIKTNTGNDPVSGGLVSGMLVVGRVSGSIFRLVNDQASAAILAQAEAAAAEAAAARDAALSAVPNTFPTTRSALKALNTATIKAAYLTEQGREGQFVWRAGDFSAEVSSDSGEYTYVASDADPDGSSGVWVRTPDVAVAGFAADPTVSRLPYSSASLTGQELANTPFALTRGSADSPDARSEPLFMIKKFASSTDFGTTGAVLAEKRTIADGAHVTALFAETVDYAGWDNTGTQNFIEGARLQAILAGGTANGSAYGVIAFAGGQPGATYKFMVGCEADVANNDTDAPVPANFNNQKFSAPFLATSGFGTKKVDAGFMTNPFNGVANRFRTGFLVTENSTEVAAFASRATTTIGIDLACGPGNQTYSAMRIPNNVPVHGKNAAGSGEVAMIRVDPSNRVVLGGGTGVSINLAGTERLLSVDANGFVKAA